MFNNLSGSSDTGGTRGGVVRRLGQRKSDSSGPKVSRLGSKKLADVGQSAKVVRKLGNKSPKSDQSLAPSEAGSEDWSEIGSEEMNSLSAGESVPSEPCTKTTTYKCGPVDKEAVMSRLRAQREAPKRDDWVIEEIVSQDIISKNEGNPTKLKLDEIAPPPPEPQQPQEWSLRNSWLANVSRSVASLTAKVTQNVSGPAENDLGDFKELIHQRLPPEEKIKTGRKYLYEAGLDENFASPQYRRIEVQITDAPAEKIPKLQQPIEVMKPQEKPLKKTPKVEENWDWEQDNFETVETEIPKAQTKPSPKPENDWGWEDQIQEIPKPIEPSWDWETDPKILEEDTEMPELEDIPKVQESSSENDWEKEMFEPEIEPKVEKAKFQENEWEREIYDSVAAAKPEKSEVIVEVMNLDAPEKEETGWDDSWEEEEKEPQTLPEKSPDPVEIPTLTTEEKRKLEDQIKMSLNFEVNKFYDEKSSSAWEDDEEWSAPTQSIPVVYHFPTIPEPEPDPPVYHEVYTESESESEGSEDEGIQKERKQTKQKSVQECIELLMKNRAELEQRKAELTEEFNPEPDMKEEELPTIENQVMHSELMQDGWGPEPAIWGFGTEIQVQVDTEQPKEPVQVLETPELQLAQSMEKTTQSQGVSWEDEEELSSLVANAVHRPLTEPQIERSAWQNDWDGEIDEPVPENRRTSDVKMQEEVMEEGRHDSVVPSFQALPHAFQNTIEVISVNPTQLLSNLDFPSPPPPTETLKELPEPKENSEELSQTSLKQDFKPPPPPIDILKKLPESKAKSDPEELSKLDFPFPPTEKLEKLSKPTEKLQQTSTENLKNEESTDETEGAWSLDPVLKSIQSLVIPDAKISTNIFYGPPKPMTPESLRVYEAALGDETFAENSIESDTDSTSLSSVPSKMSVDLGVHSDLDEMQDDVEPCVEPVLKKKLAYRCGDDEDENRELEAAFPPLHAVRLEPIGASREDDPVRHRQIEGQEPHLPIKVPDQPQDDERNRDEAESEADVAEHKVECKPALRSPVADKDIWSDREFKVTSEPNELIEEKNVWGDVEPEEETEVVEHRTEPQQISGENVWSEAESEADLIVEHIQPAENVWAEAEIVPAVNIVHFCEPENPVVENLVNEDEDGDGWDDWGDDAPVSSASRIVDGDGWEDPPRPPLVNQSSESAEDGWDDWGDMEGDRQNDPEEEEAEHVEEPIQEEVAPFLERQQLENIFNRLENANQKSQQQWNWKSNFGLSMLANASKNVASFTTTVSQNLSTALETSIPQPEEMARIIKEDERKEERASIDERKEEELAAGGQPSNSSKPVKKKMALNNLVSGVTQISSKVITGGLDTLEGIGKKTINIIQENDGIISKTKAFVLDLDRKGADPEPEEVQKRPKLPQFETIFDDSHGLVHFEALRLLSKQSQIKLEILMSRHMGDVLEKIQKKLLDVDELCAIQETSDVSEDAEGNHTPGQLEERLSFAVRDLEVEIGFDEISATWKRTTSFMRKEAHTISSFELYVKALEAIAEFTSLILAKFQELANELTVCKYHSAENEADAINGLVTTCFWHINGIATRFNRQLNNKTDCPGDDIKTYTTNIFLEASNANGYIRKSFKLFVPIIQIGVAA